MAVDGWVLEAVSQDLWRLLVYASFSLFRMVSAIFFSYVFAVLYGVSAARSRRAERVLMPLLDILQSVPILGFFPAAIFFFVAVFNEAWIGVELAAVFLIFTSQAWNLAFAVYESVSAIPTDLEEASNSLRLRGWVRFRRLYLPACIPKLVYDGMMSWAGGWYFLVAAEMITLGSKRYNLQGIGGFLAESTYAGDYVGTVLGLGVLVSLVLSVDLLFWRPLRGYAERFRYEGVALERVVHHTLFHVSRFAWLKSRVKLPLPANVMERSPVVSAARFAPLVKGVRHAVERPVGLSARQVRMLQLALAVSFLMLVLTTWGVHLITGVKSFFEVVVQDLRNPALLQEMFLIPSALGSSVIRLLLAYLLCVAVALPIAVKMAGGGRMFGTSIFAIQVLASLPATALFPLIIIATINLPGGLYLTSVILTMTGMLWYLLFNLIAGVRSIPSDLVEAAETYRVRGVERWRRLMLPAVLSSFVTGSITAWGGGWNALVVSEYIVFGGEVLSVPGVGAMLDKAAYELGSVGLLFISVSVMVVTIVGMNRLFWRRLYRFVLSRYRVDY